MESGIYQIVDGSLVHLMRFDTISNNLANINSNAFKRDIITFGEGLVDSYVSETDYTPGPISRTGNQLDVALPGDGFFEIETTNGIRYTRDGCFKLNLDGHLVTQRGDAVLGENGPINVSGNEVSIGRDGKVVVDGVETGRLSVVDFNDRKMLRKEGRSYFGYEGPPEGITKPENVQVAHGYIERSNVSTTVEMVEMLEAFRAFESAQKTIQAMDEVTEKLVNDPALIQ